MATIKLRTAEDKYLQFDTSECITREVEIPSGAIDLRFGVLLGISSSTETQTFSPISSIYETCRMLFVCDPTSSYSPERYVGVGGSLSSPGCSISGGEIRITATTAVSNTSWPLVAGGISASLVQTGTVGARLETAGNYSGSAAFIMVRLYTSASVTRLEFRRRNVNNGNVLLSSEGSDSVIRENVSDLSRTAVQCSCSVSNVSLNEVKHVFFSWPFFNVQGRLHAMVYRGLPN